MVHRENWGIIEQRGIIQEKAVYMFSQPQTHEKNKKGQNSANGQSHQQSSY